LSGPRFPVKSFRAKLENEAQLSVLAQSEMPSVIKANAADPDFNGHTGHRTVKVAAKGIVELATPDEDGPTGGYLHDEGPVPW
jgi:hypothetical protein